MISFSFLDSAIVTLFFLLFIAAAFWRYRSTDDADEYLLSGRRIGLTLFVLTTVSTWYGGILGVGEFTYRYGIASWFTQGLPYYFFAILFAFFFAGRVRKAALHTIPDKLEAVYGRKTALAGAALVFTLVNPAPYLLMAATMLTLFLDVNLAMALIIIVIPIALYLIAGGFTANVQSDVFLFVMMFAGFGAALVYTLTTTGGYEALAAKLPETHLEITGGASPVYILVWFFIALWTFADPGFHQRAYSAKTEKVARNGILISVVLWAVFDFLTTSTGLFSKALLPDLENPVLAFPLFAEAALPSGIKGLFLAALFATVLSTLNSFLFLAGSTLGKDVLYALNRNKEPRRIKRYTIYGIAVSSVLAVALAAAVPSVIDLWYLLGSFCIPGLILLITGAYFPQWEVSPVTALTELAAATSAAVAWHFLRDYCLSGSDWFVIEPMLVGLVVGFAIHTFGVIRKRKSRQDNPTGIR